MVKKCPPGIICVENNTMYIILGSLLVGVIITYISVYLSEKRINKEHNQEDNTSLYTKYNKYNYNKYNMFNVLKDMKFPSPFNLDFVPKFGSGITYANDILNNPYTPPLKNDNIYTSYGDVRPDIPVFNEMIPINVNTRHYDSSYRQVGILTPVSGGHGGHGNMLKDNIIPLMGRPLDRSRDKWNFYTINNSNNNIKLPIVNKGKSCTNEYGCDNLYNGDSIYVEGLKQPFKVTMYDNDTMKYLPFV
jgi:hypothetical protein